MADDTKRAEGQPPPPPQEDRRADTSSPLLQRLAQLNASRAAPKLPGVPAAPAAPAPKPGATPSPDVTPTKPPLGMGKPSPAAPPPAAPPPPTPTTAAVVTSTPSTGAKALVGPPTIPEPTSPARATSAPELPSVPTHVGPPPAPELPPELIENASVLTVPVQAPLPTPLSPPGTPSPRRPNTAPIVSAPGVVATREAAPMRASSEPSISEEPSTLTEMPGAPTTVGPAPDRMDAARLEGVVTNTGLVLVDHDPSLDVLDTGADTLPPDSPDPTEMPGVPTTVGPAPLPEDDGELAGEPTRVVVNPQAEPAPEPAYAAGPKTLLDPPMPPIAAPAPARRGFVEAKTTFEVDPSASPTTLPPNTAPMAVPPALQDSGAWPRPDGVISGSLGGDEPPARSYEDTGGREVTPIEVPPPHAPVLASSGAAAAQVSGEVEVPAYKRPPADAPSPAERAAAAAALESSRRRAALTTPSTGGSGPQPVVANTTGAVSFRSGNAVGAAVAMSRAETEPPPPKRATWPLLVLGLLVGLAGGVGAMWFFGDRLRGGAGDVTRDAPTRQVPTTGVIVTPDAPPAVTPPPVAVIPDAAPPDAPPAACKLHVTSLPAGAQVVIDGVDAGVTPLLDLKWPCGSIALVARAGRLEANRKLELTDDKDAWVFVGLGRGLAKVDILSNPPGAMVEIGGQPAGMTPLNVELPPGKTTVRASHPGHREAAQILIPRAGRANRVMLNLAPMRRGR